MSQRGIKYEWPSMDRRMETTFSHWLMYNDRIFKYVHGVYTKIFIYRKDFIIDVDLDMFPEEYKAKFIRRGVDRYIDGLLKSVAHPVFSTLVSYERMSFVFEYYFTFEEKTYHRKVTYLFDCRIQTNS